MALAEGYEIELFEAGGPAGARCDEVLAFWSEHAALDGDTARARLPRVISVLRDPSGGIAASSSAVDGAVARIGGRRFWIYRCLAPSEAARDAIEPMLTAVWPQLSGRAGTGGAAPIGICFPVGDPELIAVRDEAVWPETGMLFAGWSRRGEQLRVRYFDGAEIL